MCRAAPGLPRGEASARATKGRSCSAGRHPACFRGHSVKPSGPYPLGKNQSLSSPPLKPRGLLLSVMRQKVGKDRSQGVFAPLAIPRRCYRKLAKPSCGPTPAAFAEKTPAFECRAALQPGLTGEKRRANCWRTTCSPSPIPPRPLRGLGDRAARLCESRIFSPKQLGPLCKTRPRTRPQARDASIATSSAPFYALPPRRGGRPVASPRDGSATFAPLICARAGDGPKNCSTQWSLAARHAKAGVGSATSYDCPARAAAQLRLR